MKPYKNLKSKNLGLLLLLARIVAVIGILFTAITLFVFTYLIFSTGIYGVTTIFAFVPMSVSILFLSGLMAAIVAFEENYRVKTEYLIKSDKI